MAVPGYPHNALALSVGVGAVALAALVLRAAPARPINWLLAAILALEGFAIGSSGLFALERSVHPALEAVNGAFFVVLFFLAYPQRIATLATPVAAPFRSPAGRAATIGVTAVLLAADLLTGVVGLGLVARWSGVVQATYTALFLVTFIIIGVYALVAAVSADYRTPVGSAARARAGASDRAGRARGAGRRQFSRIIVRESWIFAPQTQLA